MDIVDDHRMVMTAISAKRDQMRMIVGKIGMLMRDVGRIVV